MAEQKSPKLKIFIWLLIFAIIIGTYFFSQLQKRLAPSTNDSLSIQKIDEKKAENDQKKDHNKAQETDKTKPALTWPEFSQKFQTFEDKRLEVLTTVEQQLPKKLPDKNISSLKTNNLASTNEIIKEPIEEEKTSWGKVIQHWQQLNAQQQNLSKLNKSE